MSKFNRFAMPAVAVAAVLSVGSVLGLAQTNTNPAQSGQSSDRNSGQMMGGWGGKA